MSTQQVDLHVDPLCPWCWLTALWLFEVERVRPVTITTRLFSLAEVNKEHAEASPALQAGQRALRVMVAARRSGGEDAVRGLYLALGEAHHERGESLEAPATIRDAVLAAGLDGGLAETALADDSTLAELTTEHAAVVERGAFGVPTLSIDGSAPFFGPIVDHRITGEEAGDLWDRVAPVLSDPRIFELKRERTRSPQVGRERVAAASAD